MVLAILAAIVAALVAVFGLVPRMVESRMTQANERFKSQLEDAKSNRELTTLERGTPYKINELLTQSLIRFAETGERTAEAMEKLVIDNKKTTEQIIEQSKIASTRIAEQGAATAVSVNENTVALGVNSASMSVIDTNFQTSISKLMREGSIPTQRIEEIVLAIKALLEIFDPIIRSIPDNMVVMKGLRDVYAASERLVTQATKTPVAPEDKEEAEMLVGQIVSNVSNPPVTAAAAPDSLATVPP